MCRRAPIPSVASVWDVSSSRGWRGVAPQLRKPQGNVLGQGVFAPSMRNGEHRYWEHAPGQRLAEPTWRGIPQCLAQIVLTDDRPIELQQVLLQYDGERICWLVTVGHAWSVTVARISAHREQ